MKALIWLPLVLALLAAPLAAEGDKAEVLGKIEALLAEGDLDHAKHMIDHFLGKNPKDADLLRLLQSWRVRKGELGPLLKEAGIEKPAHREKLRELCFRIVDATAAGNPEEWPAMRAVLQGGEDDFTRMHAIFTRLHEHGPEKDRRLALELMSPAPPAPPHDRSTKELEESLRAGAGPARHALREVERRKLKALKPWATTIFAKAEDPEVRAAAACALFAIGDESPRKPLLKALESDQAVEAVDAARVLIAYPGKGAAPLRALFVAVQANESIGRAKPTILSLVVEGIGNSKEPGARKFLEGMLGRPDLRVDAARALGALGDDAAVPALVAFLRAPPPEEEGAAAGGLGYLGGQGGAAKAAAAEEVRPLLAGAIAILRCTGAKR